MNPDAPSTRCGLSRLACGAAVLALASFACASDAGTDGEAEATPRDTTARDAGAFVALTRSATEGADYEVFRSVEALVEASELVVAGEIAKIEAGRTMNADEPGFFRSENVMLSVRVTEVLAGETDVRAGDEILVEWPRPGDLTAQQPGVIPPVPVARYSGALPTGLRTLVAANDFTELNQNTVAKINVASHKNRTIYSPYRQGFVIEGADNAAIYASTVVPTPSEVPGEAGYAPQTFDELLQTIREIGRSEADLP